MPDPAGLRIARSELLLGNDMDAKRARARRLADVWLAGGDAHRVVFVDTVRSMGRPGSQAGALPGQVAAAPTAPGSIASHDRRLITMEEPTELAHALGSDSRPDTLIVVDCLTLWLTASMMRAMQPDASDAYMATGQPAPAAAASIADAVRACRGPLVIVGDAGEASHGQAAGGEGAEAPGASRDARRLLEALGDLQQQAAAACERVSLVSGEQVFTLKDTASAS